MKEPLVFTQTALMCTNCTLLSSTILLPKKGTMSCIMVIPKNSTYLHERHNCLGLKYYHEWQEFTRKAIYPKLCYNGEFHVILPLRILKNEAGLLFGKIEKLSF